MIAITMDLDWASDEVLDDSLELLARYDVSATLFMTHRPARDVGPHELAIHPHFETLALADHLRERLALFPDARGTRSHALFDTYRLQELYRGLGLRYQSNVVLYRQLGLAAYAISPGIVELPIYYMDNIDIMMRRGQGPSMLADLQLDAPGLKVFDFHPIHVFLNSESMAQYDAAKPHQRDTERLLGYRNGERHGTRDLFISVLDWIMTHQRVSPTLTELVDRMDAS